MIDSYVTDRRLSGNTLKIIAAITMLIDHIGVILLPNVPLLRVIGRLAFPIYAFMIAEGCAYTRNKLRYFLSVFLLGAACQIVYAIYDSDVYLGILITFSLSILVIYAMQFWKDVVFSSASGLVKKCAATALLIASIAGVYLLSDNVQMDYGFWGAMVPVSASILRKPAAVSSEFWEKIDQHIVRVVVMGVGLILVPSFSGSVQMYSLLSLPLLLIYSGKRGKANLKYFFYIFYPLHLAALQGIAWLLYS